MCNWKARGGVGWVGSEVTALSSLDSPASLTLSLSLSSSPETLPAPLEPFIM